MTLVAMAETFLLSRPKSTASRMGMEKKPRHSLMKFMMPVPKYMTKGEMKIATMPEMRLK